MREGCVCVVYLHSPNYSLEGTITLSSKNKFIFKVQSKNVFILKLFLIKNTKGF